MRIAAAQEKTKIGISGGTFDPIHNGHLIAAQEIREALRLDRVIFIPSGKPPHKADLSVTEAGHRYNMVSEAVKDNPFFEVSRIEMERPGYTYTVDTLRQLKAVYGENTSLYFIIGADVIPELHTWRSFEEVFRLCCFAAVLRSGYTRDSFANEIKHLRKTYMAEIQIVDIPLIGISSTMVREKVANGKAFKYLVPEDVEKYIYNNGLYRKG